MNRKMLCCLGLILTLVACRQEGTIQKPKNLISEDKMISFLIDLHIAEAKVGYIKVKDRDSLEIIFRNYEQSLFKKHNISDSVYFQSYEYYLADMEKMHRIYGAVVDSLSVMNSMEENKDMDLEISN